ncbi:MAG: hypothetical protein Q4C36_09685 [Coriobacteriia bacterium]|nr:hypothetical protein [Coriobacteriia bacterium]
MVDIEKPARSIGGAIGVAVLCDACMIIGINVALAMMYGVYGSRGGLLPLAISIVFAVIWKSGTKSVGFFAILSFAIGAAIVFALGVFAQSL